MRSKTPLLLRFNRLSDTEVLIYNFQQTEEAPLKQVSSIQLPAAPLSATADKDGFWILTLDDQSRHFSLNESQNEWTEDFSLANPQLEASKEQENENDEIGGEYGLLSFKYYGKALPPKKQKKEGEPPKKKRRKRLGGKASNAGKPAN